MRCTGQMTELMFCFISWCFICPFQTYSVRREVYHRESKSIYFTLAFAGIALMAAVIVGVAVLRRRNARSPQNQVSV